MDRANREWERTFDAISDLIMVLDDQHKILRANQAMADALGMTEEEMTGRPCHELVHGAKEPPAFCPHTRLLADGKEHSAEVVEPHLRGIYDVRVSPLVGKNGQVTGSVHIIRDVTDRKRAEEALRESETKFRNLFNNAEVGMFRTRLDGSEILEINEKLLNIFGRTREEMQGCPSVIHWADPREREEMVRRLNADGLVTDFECKMLNKHGEVRTCVTSLRLYQEQGVLEGSITDITERKRTATNVQKLYAEKKLILDSAWEGMFGIDRNGNHTFVNPSAARMLGYEMEELIGRHSHSTWHHSTLDGSPYPEEDCPIYATLRDGTLHHSRDELFWRKDGSNFLAECMSAPIVDEGEITGAVVSFFDVTESRKARQALLEARERLELALKGADLGLWDWHVQSGAASVNERAAEIVGYSLDEIGQKFSFWESLLHPEDRREALERVFNHLAGFADHYEHEYRVRAKSGEWKWILSRGKVVARNEEGKPTRMTGTYLDITDRKHAEQALRESEERYRAIFDNAGIGINVVDMDRRFVRANPALLKMLGYTEEELRQLIPLDITHPEDREIANQPLDGLVEGKSGPWRVENRYITKDGSVIWGDLSVSIVRDVEGMPRAAVGVIADITEQRKVQIALKESEERLRRMIDSSPIGIRILQDGKYVYVNPKFVEIFGYDTEDEIVGLPVEALYEPGSRKLILQRIADRAAGNKIPTHYEAAALTKNGNPVEVEVWGTEIDYLEKRSSLAFVTDVSEEKRLRSQLLQAQKMQAIGLLAGGIAHDFNNLLTVVLGFSDLLLAGKDERDPSHSKLQKIHQAARNGADLVQRILAFSRKAEINLRPLNLNHEIEQVKKLLSRTIPKMIEIKLVLSDDLASVHADPIQVEQVLMNLAVNAKHAMQDGGKLTIETRNVRLDEEYCRMHLEAKPGNYVLLSVSDTGHGMDKETVNHIFEPFYTTKETGRGTGLGLAMVYGIVKHHGGYIMCYSEPGAGTTFSIYLPVIETEAQSEPLTDKPVPRNGTETVLLVDDEEMIRDLGKEILEQSGYKVLTAASGTEALNLYEKDRAEISLLILDLIMPGMGGKQCLEELLKVDPQVRVLISSGFSADGHANKTIELGAKGFVAKPYNVTQMLQVVREALDA